MIKYVRGKIAYFLWKKCPWLILDLKDIRNKSLRKNKDFRNLFIKIAYVDKRILLSFREMYNIYKIIKQIKKVKGDVAEVGVYKGGSAKLISAVKGEKHLYLFDTFKGMPIVQKFDSHKEGDFSDTSLISVKNYLKDCNGIHFYPGFFPYSAKNLKKSIVFSFVHLDVDIYKSTLNSLNFFYPRMSKGGVILCHDYSTIRSVKKAVDEFLKDKPEIIVEMFDTQCLFIKI